MGAAAATARASFGAVIPRLSLDRDLEQSTSIENGGRGEVRSTSSARCS
jgi:hypothetical protein